jgi:hypothetical protein
MSNAACGTDYLQNFSTIAGEPQTVICTVICTVIRTVIRTVICTVIRTQFDWMAGARWVHDSPLKNG